MLTQYQTLEQWLAYTLDDLRDNLRRMKIEDTGHLLASVEGHLVAAAGGDVEKLSLAYAAYGRFVELGVGRGMGAGVRKVNSEYARIRDERGRLYQHSRKPRVWASKVLGKQTTRLAIILSDYYGETTLARIGDALPTKLEITL